ncbi:hypothetical protein K435DRAFT_800801 [Dendrothele bispora CBS 962.96]|uniref:Uncharacterized protein n=1 Tax=Dendrothele bispora (strain CBS 962.96) TaxID=1314807 RepID=A0A4S8LSX9_DENBC|nr:hypothetical protein K435DRAFT_800801 [Dendrothele bispora CBS 962.96]
MSNYGRRRPSDRTDLTRRVTANSSSSAPDLWFRDSANGTRLPRITYYPTTHSCLQPPSLCHPLRVTLNLLSYSSSTTSSIVLSSQPQKSATTSVRCLPLAGTGDSNFQERVEAKRRREKRQGETESAIQIQVSIGYSDKLGKVQESIFEGFTGKVTWKATTANAFCFVFLKNFSLQSKPPSIRINLNLLFWYLAPLRLCQQLQKCLR